MQINFDISLLLILNRFTKSIGNMSLWELLCIIFVPLSPTQPVHKISKNIYSSTTHWISEAIFVTFGSGCFRFWQKYSLSTRAHSLKNSVENTVRFSSWHRSFIYLPRHSKKKEIFKMLLITINSCRVCRSNDVNYVAFVLILLFSPLTNRRTPLGSLVGNNNIARAPIPFSTLPV